LSSKSRIIRVNALLTTNGVLLEKKFDELYDAGLRRVALGIYGNEESYPFYVQRSDPYSQIVRGIARARERGGKEVIIALGWLLMRPTCNLTSLHDI